MIAKSVDDKEKKIEKYITRFFMRNLQQIYLQENKEWQCPICFDQGKNEEILL